MADAPDARREQLAAIYGNKAVDTIGRIIGVCDTLSEFAADDADGFAADRKTQWAVEMGLIRIGESVNRLPDELLQQFPDQPWRQIVAMRNFAAHQYDDLEPKRVWRTLTGDVPRLRSYLNDVVLGRAPDE